VDDSRVAGQTLLVSDGRDLSTPELLNMIANSIGRSARLFPLPVPLLRLGGMALGRLNDVDRLVGSLQIDSSVAHEILAWTPPVSVEEGIKRMVMGETCRS
jgi:nucleoside-diphosphate-sugar epimerase